MAQHHALVAGEMIHSRRATLLALPVVVILLLLLVAAAVVAVRSAALVDSSMAHRPSAHGRSSPPSRTTHRSRVELSHSHARHHCEKMSSRDPQWRLVGVIPGTADRRSQSTVVGTPAAVVVAVSGIGAVVD